MIDDAAGRAALDALLGRSEVGRLFAALDGAGEEVRIVGGAIRNALLGREVHEVDFTSTALPEVTTARAEAAGFKVVPTGLDHGTVTVIVAGHPFEVTTLREDVETFGRRATVRFGRSFAADAVRRDFTINALSMTRDGHLHDYAEGLADLAARRVRFIGLARNRIREDYLRILRFFRFHADYAAGPLDPEGFEATVRERAGLAILSRERIRAEILKLLAGRRAVETAAAMAEAGFFGAILGGVVEVGRLARAIASERAGPDPVRRLAAFAVLVEEDAERLRERLRLSNGEGDRLAAYGRMTARLRSLAQPLDARAIRVPAAEAGLEPVADALAATSGEPRPLLTDDGRAALEHLVTGATSVPVFPLRGADLMARGVARGPRVGELLDEARRLWLAAGAPTEGAETTERLLDAVLDRAEAPGAAQTTTAVP